MDKNKKLSDKQVTKLIREQYWAAAEKEKVGDELMRKVDNYFTALDTSGQYYRLQASYAMYYGHENVYPGYDDYRKGIKSRGQKGEIQFLKTNHFRNVLKNLQNLILANRPAMEVRAVNSTYEALQQAKLGNKLIDYYMREKKLEKHLRDAVESALVFGEGYIKLEWDNKLGEEYGVDPESNRIQYTGDISYTTCNPFDVLKDLTRTDNKHDWLIVRNRKNKHDLAAKHRDLATKIVDLPAANIKGQRYYAEATEEMQSDLVNIYEFFHAKTDSLPDGRLVIFCDADVVLYDGPLPYREVPLYRIAVDDQIGTGYGYTPAFDLIPLQESIDRLYTTILTNQSAFGIQNIVVSKDADLDAQNLAGGLRVLKKNPNSEIEPLNLTSTPTEVFEFLKMLVGDMETLSGVNSVVRGNPEASLKSGAALAMIASQAIQFVSGLQQSYHHLLESVGGATLNMLKDYANAPRVAQIVGKSTENIQEVFSSDDLSDYNRVVVDTANPLSKTTAGRTEIANNLLQQGLITAEQYITVLETGNLSAASEDVTTQMDLCRKENEVLRKGQTPIMLASDDHEYHIAQHLAILNDPVVRVKPEVVDAVLNHVEEHKANVPLRSPDGMPTDPNVGGGGEGGALPPNDASGTPGAPSGPPGAPPAEYATQGQSVNLPNMPALPEGAPAEAEQAYNQVPSGVPGKI